MITPEETKARAIEATKPRTFELHALGSCRVCKRTYRRPVTVTVTYPPWRDGFPPPRSERREKWPAAVECCGRRVSLELVRGSRSKTPCDARCTTAKGHKCECQCAGKNHGADHD